MLREIHNVRQVPGEPRRRWFGDDVMDLFVWHDDSGRVTGFQLAYDKPHAEKAITWRAASGFEHTGVDDGFRAGQHPGSPLLVADGEFQDARVLDDFRARAAQVDPAVAALVVERLGAYPGASRREGAAPREEVPARTDRIRGLLVMGLLGACLVLLWWLLSGSA